MHTSLLKKTSCITVFLALLLFSLDGFTKCLSEEYGLPLWYWTQPQFVNFGDHLSLKVVERILNEPVRFYKKKFFFPQRKLLAIGSLLYFANDNDVLWGTGTNAKFTKRSDFHFSQLDIRAVRGPLTRQFLMNEFGIDCPEVYGDPALLVPYLFPEFKKKENPSTDFIVILHFSDQKYFSKELHPYVVYATDPWTEVIEKILDTRLVISSAMHGIIVAEAFGIPARMLRLSEAEPLFKYQDYYLGTNRSNLQFANSIEEALSMGGEVPMECDLEKLYNAFPFEFWPNTQFIKPNFSKPSPELVSTTESI